MHALHSLREGPKHSRHAGLQFTQLLLLCSTYCVDRQLIFEESHMCGLYNEFAHVTQPAALHVRHFALHFWQLSCTIRYPVGQIAKQLPLSKYPAAQVTQEIPSVYILQVLHGDGQSTQYFPLEYVVKGHYCTHVTDYDGLM